MAQENHTDLSTALAKIDHLAVSQETKIALSLSVVLASFLVDMSEIVTAHLRDVVASDFGALVPHPAPPRAVPPEFHHRQGE